MAQHRSGRAHFFGPAHLPPKRGPGRSIAGQKKWFFAGAAAFVGLLGGGVAMLGTGAQAAKHSWSQGAPRVCDYDHDGVEDFQGWLGREHGPSWNTVISGATFEPLCDTRTKGCEERCVTIDKPARVYNVTNQTLSISDTQGRLLKQIGE